MTHLFPALGRAAAVSLLFTLAAFAADNKAAAERAVMQAYRDYADAYARKDAAAVYRNCDPNFTETNNDDGQSTTLAVSRQSLADSFAKLKSIKVTVEPQASELVGTQYFIRYKQTMEIQFPLRDRPSTNWYVAEDVWQQQKNGEWRRLSMKVITDKATEAKQRLEVQKKVIEIQDEQRRSQRCLNGLGYGCGLPQ